MINYQKLVDKIHFSSTASRFITVCTYGRRCILGSIKKYPTDKTPLWTPTPWGREVAKVTEYMSLAYVDVEIEHYIVMPNHVHMIINTTDDIDKKTNQFVLDWKSYTTKRMTRIEAPRHPFWNSDFEWEHLRNTSTYNTISSCIRENPKRWRFDKYYSPSANIT